MVRVSLMIAALTALFMGVGYLLGGSGGMVIALVLAGGMNLFAYWNSDKMVLRMHGARQNGRAELPWFHDMIGQLAQRAGELQGLHEVAELELPVQLGYARLVNHGPVIDGRMQLGNFGCGDVRGIPAAGGASFAVQFGHCEAS